MPIFIYRCSDQKGIIEEGQISALNSQSVFNRLRRRKLIPISIIEKGTKKDKRKKIAIPFFGKISIDDKIFLTSRLSAIIRSGLSLQEAIGILLEDVEKPMMKSFLVQMKINMERGEPLSAVFADYKKYFSPIFVGLIKAGEKSGNLEQILGDLGNQIKNTLKTFAIGERK